MLNERICICDFPSRLPTDTQSKIEIGREREKKKGQREREKTRRRAHIGKNFGKCFRRPF